MKIVEGSGKIPVLYTAHHASCDFHEFSQRSNLNDEQQVRFSDYGTNLTVPTNGIVALVAEHSRALGDLNRDPDDAGRFASLDNSKPTQKPIWQIGNELTDTEKTALHSRFYAPFHAEVCRELRDNPNINLVVAWDNTAHYNIGKNEAGDDQLMKPIILSNRGREGAAENDSEVTSCEPELLLNLADNLRKTLGEVGLANEVCLNLVFKGGYICRTYSSRRNQQYLESQGIMQKLQSLQVEYDTLYTHSQKTLELNQGNVGKLKQAFELAIEQTLLVLQ